MQIFISFLLKMAVLPREFCNFTPDFCGLAPMCIVGRVRRSQQKTVHAEPCEAMPLQQGGHWVGTAGVTTFCRKGVYYDAHRWVPNFEHSELSEVMMQR